MSGLFFNKIAAGVLCVALAGVGGAEVWRRVAGGGHHAEPVSAAVPHEPETAAAPEAGHSTAPDPHAGEGAPPTGEAVPPEGDPVTATDPTTPAAPGAAPATPVAEATPPPVPAGPDYKALFAAASLEEGKGLAAKCVMCHDVTDPTKTLVGPSLHSLFGRDVASVAGFTYSQGPGSLSAVEGVWDAKKLDAFLENPKSISPATYMVMAGMKRESERVALMAYIRSLTNGEPAPIE